jgi:hypothetical protein
LIALCGLFYNAADVEEVVSDNAEADQRSIPTGPS